VQPVDGVLREVLHAQLLASGASGPLLPRARVVGLYLLPICNVDCGRHRPFAVPYEEHMTKSDDDAASARIDKTIADLGGWRGETLSRMRKLIKETDPDLVEEVKWVKPSNPAGVPTWSHDGIICTGETYKTTVKLTFANGASLEDPSDLFNSSLGGNTRRAIDIHEGQEVDARAFKALIRAAVDFNTTLAKARSKRAKEGAEGE
jgi:hypothetical protein